MTAKPNHENPVIAVQKHLAKPSREVQSLLRTAGPVRPNVKDLEDVGHRKSRRESQKPSKGLVLAEIVPETQNPVQQRLPSIDGQGEHLGEIASNGVMGKSEEYDQDVTSLESEKTVHCVCGTGEHGKYSWRGWIQCNGCRFWQHTVCMSMDAPIYEKSDTYNCQNCDPNGHPELQKAIAQSERPWEVMWEEHDKKARNEAEIYGTQPTRSGENGYYDHLLPLTAECLHYTQRKDVDWDLQKYWDQRYSLFSLFDQGILMTNDSWFGVTPEPVALKIANDFSSMVSNTKNVLVDLFGGVGGNTIAFARSGRWSKIISIEKDPAVLACAQRNAAIYGVSQRITWINDDCFSFLGSPSSNLNVKETVVFASPPWGGPGYRTDEVFNLSLMQPYSAEKIYDAIKEMDAALFLPRTSNLNQIARLNPQGGQINVVQYCMEGASKGLVAYILAATVKDTGLAQC